MNSIIQPLLINLLILTIRCEGLDFPHTVGLKKVEQIANAADNTINNVVKLKKGGRLGYGSFGFVWNGTVNGIEVAFKFSLNNLIHEKINEKFIDREYRMFAAMNAINNEAVEHNGVPALYYRGTYDDYDIIGITLLDELLEDKIEELPEKKLTALDVLLVFQKMVRILKFIHGCGVIHQDIKPENIMLRLAEIFLIDFNMAMADYEEGVFGGGSIVFASLRGHVGLRRDEWDDFESLHYTLLYLAGVTLPWNDETYDENIVLSLKKNVAHALAIQITDEILRTELNELYVLVRARQGKPKYNRMYKRLTNAIQKFEKPKFSLFGFPRRPVYFSWLNDDDKMAAKKFKMIRIEKVRGPPHKARSRPVPKWPNQIQMDLSGKLPGNKENPIKKIIEFLKGKPKDAKGKSKVST